MKLPENYLAAMKELLGEEYEAYLASFEEPKSLGLRVNTRKISVEDFLKLTPFHLTPVPWTENGFYYEEGEAVTRHPHYYAGLYYIQEPSAMIPASRLPIEPGDRVLDLCAAPGGKATELGARLMGTGVLLANDISNSRAKGLLKNLELFGIGNMFVTSETPEKLCRFYEGCFDKILIDAPCSGEGMFRRDPSMVKSWEEHGPAYYAQLQREILESAVRLLAPGGKLLYSTCTFSTMENEKNVEALLLAHPELTLLPIQKSGGLLEGRLPGCVRAFPHKLRGEGHFAALLEKAGEAEGPARAAERKKEKLPAELLEFLEQLPPSFRRQEQIRLLEGRAYLLPEALSPARGLRFLRTGLYLGEWKRNRFEPSQSLAMALKLEDFPQSLSLSSEDGRVMRYLKGETVELLEEEASIKKGWILVGCDGYPLGWAKAAGGLLKNKYYPGWRVQ